jgi:hypothetical protein
MDVFWRGYRIVWENLFKHYLVCLNVAWALLGVCGEDHPFDWKNIPINYFHGRNLTPAQEKIHAEIFRDAFAGSVTLDRDQRTGPVGGVT